MPCYTVVHMASSRTDVELIERACANDVEAFAEVYDRHAPQLLALLRRLLGDKVDAQDVLHDVFLEAWRGVRSYDAARGTVRAWLAVRARSRALDALGQQARQTQHLPYDAAPLMAATSERALAVQQALAKLPAQVRETLELIYFEGLTAPELSERMSVPEGTVRSRLNRGLAALKHMLQPDDGVAE
jgi:RNA polymerase sigma-70 factor, ECF subfamily